MSSMQKRASAEPHGLSCTGSVALLGVITMTVTQANRDIAFDTSIRLRTGRF